MYIKCPSCGAVTTFQYVCPSCNRDLRHGGVPVDDAEYNRIRKLPPDQRPHTGGPDCVACAISAHEDKVKARAIADQPPPKATDRRPAWGIVIEYTEKRKHENAYGKTGVVDLVLADMRERDQTGRQRYGVPLTSGNGRNSLVDAYQEALDLAVYLAAELDEHGVAPGGWPPANGMRVHDPKGWRLFCLQSMLADHLRLVLALRAHIEDAAKESP